MEKGGILRQRGVRACGRVRACEDERQMKKEFPTVDTALFKEKGYQARKKRLQGERETVGPDTTAELRRKCD